jgi:hypothetical protein
LAAHVLHVEQMLSTYKTAHGFEVVGWLR